MSQTTRSDEPILATWKISEVLRRYPQLLEVLVEASPAFSRLRNPVLRQVQTRLVTVAQAAQVAGLEPAALVQRLNTAIGLAQADGGQASTPPPQPGAAHPAAFERAQVAVDLDASPFHERGEEPFSAIMAAAAEVPPGQVFRLRNSFEPVPLYAVLGKRGFLHSTRQVGPDDWEVLFLKAGQASSATPTTEPQRAPLAAEAWDRPDATVTIDVSDLVPPEPMVRILETLEGMRPGRTLLVHHVRRPVYLYPRLDALGYVHETRDLDSGQVEILIHKPAAG